VLKSVKLLFLKYKRINLPFEIKMSRILIICVCFSVCCLAACKKSTIYGSVQYKEQAKADDDTLAEFIKNHGLSGVAKHVQGNDTIGVYYIVLDPGQGNALYTNSTQITVGDIGKLITGRNAADTSIAEQTFYETNQFHPTYPLGQMILGWQLGIPMINSGGEVRLLIPSRYAYGHYPQSQLGTQFSLSRGLPANAILDFTINLYDVTN